MPGPSSKNLDLHIRSDRGPSSARVTEDPCLTPFSTTLITASGVSAWARQVNANRPGPRYSTSCPTSLGIRRRWSAAQAGKIRPARRFPPSGRPASRPRVSAQHGVDGFDVVQRALPICRTGAPRSGTQTQPRQRRAQVVADGGQHLRALIDERANAFAHVVQRFGDLGDLARPIQFQNAVAVGGSPKRSRGFGYVRRAASSTHRIAYADTASMATRMIEKGDAGLQQQKRPRSLIFGNLKGEQGSIADPNHDRIGPRRQRLAAKRLNPPVRSQAVRNPLRKTVGIQSTTGPLRKVFGGQRRDAAAWRLSPGDDRCKFG